MENQEATMMGLIQLHLKVDLQGLKIEGKERLPNIEVDSFNVDTGIQLSLDSLTEGAPIAKLLTAFAEAVAAVKELPPIETKKSLTELFNERMNKE